ncbi:MAG: imidazole glycerol phosphate synthase subunit HisF [Candidatus Eremiobacteraeota bacterium]|nr:imidazole glycerol phosphate synthase subunit HisF [Candidatus Eremiobacteraeota bacterium]
MPSRRIIPCLDLKGGRVVKGIRFANLRDAGDPVELAKQYEAQGADEVVFLDIAATLEPRKATLDAVQRVAAELTIPFTVGGGVDSVEDIHRLLHAGCDKVSLNSAAVRNPNVLVDAARRFGSQCVVVAIDARRLPDAHFEVMTGGATVATGLDAVRWARTAVDCGAGELLITSIDRDGTKSGFDLPLLREIRDAVNVPIIASGGAGSAEDFAQVFVDCDVDAALAASLFHYGELSIGDLKTFLSRRGIDVRPLGPLIAGRV